MRISRLLVLFSSLTTVSAASAGDLRVAGYLPEYRVTAFDPEAAVGLTDLIVFSAEPTPEGGLELARLKKVPWDKLQDFERKENVRLILCIGGWGRSGGFAAVAGAPEKRRAFAKACLDFCHERKFDGIDLDWEFPQSKSQQEDYGELLRELAKTLPPRSVQVVGHRPGQPNASAPACPRLSIGYRSRSYKSAGPAFHL